MLRGKLIFEKKRCFGRRNDYLSLPESDGKNLGESFAWGDMSKNIYFQFFDTQNIFSSNLNITNLKMFLSQGGIYRLNKIKQKFWKDRTHEGSLERLEGISLSLILKD